MRRFATACALAAWCLCGASVGAEERPAPLARYFPSQDLVVYAEFDGLDAHAGAWNKTAAARILNETPTGVMLESVVTQVVQRLLDTTPDVKFTGKETMTLVKHAFRQGFAFGINRAGNTQKPTCVGLVLRGAAKGEVRTLVGRLIDAEPARPSESVIKPGGRRVMVVTEKERAARTPRPARPAADPQGFAWWVEGDDLAFSLVSPKGADAMIAALEKTQPSAIDNPRRAELAKAEETFEPVGLAFFDMAALPPLPPQAVALGLDRIRQFDYRWGFDGPALMTVTRVVAPAPRAGVLALLDQPALDTRKLPALPSGLDRFTAFSFAPGPFYDRLIELVKATDPNATAGIAVAEQNVNAAIGRSLRQDVLGHLGPLMVAYSVPTKINAPTNVLEGLAQGLVHVPKASLTIQVDDVDAFGPILDDLVQRFNAAAKDPDGGDPPAQFKPLKGQKHGYTLAAAPSVLPSPAGTRPTVVLGKNSLIIASTPEAARGALALEAKPGGLAPDDPLAQALARVPARVTFLHVNNTKNSLLPEVVANLPALVQLVGERASDARNPAATRIGGRNFGVRLRPGRGDAAGFTLKIDPDDIPAPDDLRPYLFPASFAVTTDDSGIRLVARESFPAFNPTTAAPIAVALMLPAVQSARTAARRAQSVNNLKQIGLAMHNFHSTNNHWPADIRGKDGKPLLSWRVAILPFIEAQGLFAEFHLDEPWDSPHNKDLIERMPTAYAVPGARAEPGETFYRGFRGKRTLFDATVAKDLTIADVIDGTSNTIGILEAREAVPWTKPESDIPFDPEANNPEDAQALLKELGGHFPGGFNTLLLDGSIRFIKESIAAQTLRALITRNGGEVISADSF